MHPVDRAILEDRVTAELIASELAKPLPAPGTSYWGDVLREALASGIVLDEDCGWAAALMAARQMGAVITSLKAVAP